MRRAGRMVVAAIRVGGEIRALGGQDPRARVEELRAAGLEPTCRGEMEQDRTWRGRQCYCGACGEVIPRFFDNHRCKDRGKRNG